MAKESLVVSVGHNVQASQPSYPITNVCNRLFHKSLLIILLKMIEETINEVADQLKIKRYATATYIPNTHRNSGFYIALLAFPIVVKPRCSSGYSYVSRLS